MPVPKPRSIAATLALISVMAVLFAPALFHGRILAPLDITTTLLPPWGVPNGTEKPHNQSPSDAVTQYLPYRMFAEESLREDGYIGWNPYEMGGYSLAGNTMALPGSWPMQLHRWLPFKEAWNLGIIVEFLIAGIGMLAFLRGRNIPWLPCLVGSVAYMLNAQFIIWIYHRWALGSFCWMPWVLWSFGDGFSIRPAPRRLFLLPGFLALAMLGGSLQHVAFIVIACGCLAAARFNFRRPLANAPSLLGWTAALLLSLGIAAFSLVPQIQGYLANIAIGHVRGGIGYENGISQVFFHALLIPARVWPWLAGDPQSMDAFRLLKSGYMSLNYLGTIPMLLGFAGLFVRSMPRAAKWLITAGLVIPLTPLVGPLYHRVELLFILGAAWMTAEMLGHLAQTHPTKEPATNNQNPSADHQPSPTPPLSRLTFLVAPLTSLVARLKSLTSKYHPRLLIASVAAIGIALLAGSLLPSNLRGKLEETVVSKALARSADSQFGADKPWIASRATEWTRRFSLTHPRTAWVYGLLVLGTTGLVISSKITNPQSSIVNRQSIFSGHLLILASTTIELATVFQTWTTFSDPAKLRPQSGAIETIRSLAGSHRVLQTAEDAEFARMFATPNLLAAQRIASIDGYESIQYPSPLISLKDTPANVRLRLSGVGLAVQPEGTRQPGTEAWNRAGTCGAYSLLKNPSVPPMVAAGYGPMPDNVAEIDTALSTAKALNPDLHTMNRWNFEIPDGCRWIRIAQNWHEGWQWRSAGREWQPFQTHQDHNCWISFPPPFHGPIEVQFRPIPASLMWTSSISALFAFGVLPALMRGRFGRPPL